MKIFIPEAEGKNLYLSEIINNSENEFVYGNIAANPPEDYDIVLINWPEKLFNWKPPTKENIEFFRNTIKQWKEKAKIVYVFHDLYSHYDVELKFNELFNLVYNHADGVIHLGQHSYDKYKHLFKASLKQGVIPHPLYNSLLANKNEFISNKDQAFVFLVPGNIRNNEERDLLIRGFRAVRHSNKKLIVPRMFNTVKKPKYIPWKLKFLYDFFIKKYYQVKLIGSNYSFGEVFITEHSLVEQVKKASLLFIPRYNNLNSGNLFLAITFNKLTLVPEIGNLKEHALKFNYPLFLPNSKKSLKEAISKAMLIYESSQFVEEDKEEKAQYLPKVIAYQFDMFFKELKNENRS